ncbi:hypothetical protein Patl1_17496 [Pistacia atlantica]|uniref:Uncharacterized protein n=1 Tax=Pistacia atlantica TaxID=434234 RepID=A0ACC1C0N7_9ROSI|nr:hypothetical protein Patl1_17496 [Pistacia atlantica]
MELAVASLLMSRQETVRALNRSSFSRLWTISTVAAAAACYTEANDVASEKNNKGKKVSEEEDGDDDDDFWSEIELPELINFTNRTCYEDFMWVDSVTQQQVMGLMAMLDRS